MTTLYREIKRQLIADIASGAVAPGAALPNETDLARRFQVSIGTLRRAVDELVADHILVRQQGRGTFVGRLDRDRFMFQFFRIEERGGRREFPQVRLLNFGRGRATPEEAAILGPSRTSSVYRIENVLQLQERPVILDHLVIPAPLFSGLTRTQFEQRPGTIYELYQADFGVTIVDADERVRAEPADAASATVLGLPAGTSVLRIERVAYTVDRRVAELRTSVVDSRAHDYVVRARGRT